MKRVLVVDDHAVVRYGLKLAIEAHGYEVVALAGSVSEARAFMAHTNPEILIVDINLPDGSGFELISWARKLSASLVILVLTLNEGFDYISASQKAGANAFIVKDAPLSELIAAINFAVSSPKSFSSQYIGKSLIGAGLTAREIDVLHSLNKGLSNTAIAAQLFISISTVKTHVSSILRKLGADNRIQALRTAREYGLLIEQEFKLT